MSGKSIKVGDVIEYVDDIVPETQWYMIETQYNAETGATGQYIYEATPNDDSGVVESSEYRHVFLSSKADEIDGQLATDFAKYLIRFIATDDDGVYYMQFATGNFIYLYEEYQYVYTYPSDNEYELWKPMYVYNIKSSGTTYPEHFGFYAYDDTKCRIYANTTLSYLLGWSTSTGKSTTLWGHYDFGVHPVELEVMDPLEAAFTECSNALALYRTYVDSFTAGTEPGCYGIEEVAAFQAAVEKAAEALGSDDTSNLTEEVLKTLKQDMVDTYEAVLASYITQVDTADGYYYVYQVGYDYYTTDTINGATYNNYFNAALRTYIDDDNTCYAYWAALEASPYFLWKITGKGDGAYEMRNMSNNATFNDIEYYDWVTMSEESENLVSFDYDSKDDDGNYVVNIRLSKDPVGCELYLSAYDTNYGKNSESFVLGWTTVGNPMAEWRLVQVSDEEAEAIIDAFDREQAERYYAARAIITAAEPMLEIAYDEGSATSQAVNMGDVYTNLSDAVAKASEEGENVSADTYDTLSAAYEAFLAIYVDPTDMREALDEASTYVNGLVIGTNPGTWNDSNVADELKTTIASATSYDEAGKYTADETASYTETLQNQMADMAASANKVQTDRWYEIRFATEQEITDNGWEDTNYGEADESSPEMYGKYISVAELEYDEDEAEYSISSLSKSDLEDVCVGHSLYFQAKDEITYDDYAKFRFIAVGDTAYIMQNKATGLFLKSNGTSYEDVTLSPHPSLFTISAIGYGESTISAETMDGDSHYDLYGWVYQNKLITWYYSGVGTPAGLYIEDIDETVADDYDGTEFNLSVVVGGITALCYPVSITSEDITIYGVDVDGTTVTLSPLEDNAAEAGQPFILIDGDLEDYNASDPEEEIIVLNHGYDLAKNAQTTGRLVGSYYSETVGYGKALADGNAFTVSTTMLAAVGDNSAYIDGFETTDQITIVVSDEEYDNIAETVQAVAKQDGNIYSIDGKFIGKGNLKTVQSLAHGIYIVNGVKVVVK